MRAKSPEAREVDHLHKIQDRDYQLHSILPIVEKNNSSSENFDSAPFIDVSGVLLRQYGPGQQVGGAIIGREVVSRIMT